MRLRESGKPVVASLGAVPPRALLRAVAADKIYANRHLTGSIGRDLPASQPRTAS